MNMFYLDSSLSVTTSVVLELPKVDTYDDTPHAAFCSERLPEWNCIIEFHYQFINLLKGWNLPETHSPSNELKYSSG